MRKKIKQLQDARKGTAPFVGKILKEVMGISSAHIRNISDFKSLTVLYSLTNHNTNDTFTPV
jgi:hypothetical protein